MKQVVSQSLFVGSHGAYTAIRPAAVNKYAAISSAPSGGFGGPSLFSNPFAGAGF